MKKDIPVHKVTDLAIAMVPGKEDKDMWDCYLLNFYPKPLTGVLVSSRGYGELDEKPKKTTTLRHFFEEIESHCACLIEPIQTSLFELTNEYWVSFMLDNYMYDKKYVFVTGAISDEHFTTIPFLNCQGVMIR